MPPVFGVRRISRAARRSSSVKKMAKFMIWASNVASREAAEVDAVRLRGVHPAVPAARLCLALHRRDHAGGVVDRLDVGVGMRVEQRVRAAPVP